MRLFISEPCYIECDGAILIEPFRGVTVDDVPVTTPVVAEVHDYPTHRRSPRRRYTKVCDYCKVTFKARVPQQRFCTDQHKRLYYKQHGMPGTRKVMADDSLLIHAGATGVDVKGAASGRGY